jgi:ribonucleotide reductase alpha subunit
MKTMKPAIRRKVKEYGIRNCALLTVAPTGTTGIVSGVSTGIEPLMAPVYWRNFKGRGERTLVVEPEYDLYPDIVEGAADIPVERHFEMQEVVQRHVDNAVSKTINLPTDYPKDALEEIWLRYLPNLKGTTFYRWGSREGEPYSPVTMDDAERQIYIATQDGQISRKERQMDQADCANGVCEILPGTINAVAGPHPTKVHVDEIELMDQEVFSEAMASA